MCQTLLKIAETTVMGLKGKLTVKVKLSPETQRNEVVGGTGFEPVIPGL